MVKVIALSGKAHQVFRFVELMAKAHPSKQIGDIICQK